MSQSQSMNALEARLTSHSVYLRSSDGSLEEYGTRRLRKDKVKARVEAKRDQLCVGDSSMDESSTEEHVANGFLPKVENSCGKRRSRASRTERYLKRMCNGTGNVSIKSHRSIAVDHRPLLKEQTTKATVFQPMDRKIPMSQTTTLDNKEICFVNDSPKEEPYTSHSDIGVNPLVQQTLQYFSEFDHHMASNHHDCHYHHRQHQQQKVHKSYTVQDHCHRTLKSQVHPDRSHAFDKEINPLSNLMPPKPLSRDPTSCALINGTPKDKYQQMLMYMQRSPPKSHITELCNINDNSVMDECLLPLIVPRSPLRESLNMMTVGVKQSLIEKNQSQLGLLDLNKTKYQGKPSSLQKYHNLNYFPHKKLVDTIEKESIEKQSSKNLEDALCELEAIYNSLQLGDEELLERAEKRTMEEFHYKGFTANLDLHTDEDSAFTRMTLADQSLDNFMEESKIPDRLKDDMAYRRMHPKERPSSTDGQWSLSSISYLMTSPISSRREMLYIDAKRKSRRKEPDIALDDVVFRSMQYANNILKVVEPQPPFGIPLGPITASTESDYLHTNPAKSERSRSPYIPSCEPDLVTDDLAFRNLRKDTQPCRSSRQPSPSLLHGNISGGSNCTSLDSFGLKKKRAVRSLSANLYALIKKPISPLDLDSENQTSIADDSIFGDFLNAVPFKCISRRTSDPELMYSNWQKNTWNSLDVNVNKSKEEVKQRTSQREVTNFSDVDLSDGACNESFNEIISPQGRLTLAKRNGERKAAGSDIGSSYLSSNCSTPLPIPSRWTETFTEQEISVYKKLCQDLENLVVLTKSIDGTSKCGESDLINPSNPSSDDIKNCSHSNIKSTIEDSIDNNNIDCNGQIETSPVKQEISMILDNLKSLRENSNVINSSCSDKNNEERDWENKNILIDDKAFKEITKEIYDLVTWDDIDKHKLAMKVKAEEIEVHRLKEDNENKDRVDDKLFFQNLQLAKLSGDWKESTPNNNNSGNAIITNDRRSSFTGDHSISNWEGVTKCNHKYNSMPAKTSSLLPFRHYGSKRKSSNRKSMCIVS